VQPPPRHEQVGDGEDESGGDHGGHDFATSCP
jgi:hypothetical protein